MLLNVNTKDKVASPRNLSPKMHLPEARGTRCQGCRQSGITRRTSVPRPRNAYSVWPPKGVLDRGFITACSQWSLKFPLGRHNA